jgi:hypothetical protein
MFGSGRTSVAVGAVSALSFSLLAVLMLMLSGRMDSKVTILDSA